MGAVVQEKEREAAGPSSRRAGNGGHAPVLLDAVLEGLAPRAEGLYVDATYGRGGHAQALFRALGRGELIVADRDPEAIAHARHHFADRPRCHVVQARLGELPEVLQSRGWAGRVAGVLVDLGVSSPQLDDAVRGFSFRHDGPLDMRMDPESGISAAELLQQLSQRELARILRRYGEEPQAGRIARAVVAAREAGAPPLRTRDLVALIEEAGVRGTPGRHAATRTFQALRIAVNDELGELERFLAGVIELLEPGGRLAVIAFHSLEDRLVKRFIRDASRVGDLPPSVPVVPVDLRPRLRPLGRARRADVAEVAANPRSRSAVLRLAERLS
ncbi:16S rRNA (cytosine(1402)-N(4))-methyltransferase [Halorhodospira abdelmalekii]|uniref:16S rRNA (cytosine(1402)-N(4))-methyltransferase RsmH n=1 Tax=Halorhodospira abdelmalekii TaxID=421629 RepID=UPI00190710DC|nr:16S rRNA (cytosine(1402)-N(4))-methyltransferase RsmH [Halorhodospira abdelmalekii]MBK1735597.1 16S rRNA (cytosine(1402)-N(4))-methyltransferase [Halorhodospira abdelmalekii]